MTLAVVVATNGGSCKKVANIDKIMQTASAKYQ